MPSSIPGSDISRGERRRSSPTPPTVDARAGFPDQAARAKPALEKRSTAQAHRDAEGGGEVRAEEAARRARRPDRRRAATDGGVRRADRAVRVRRPDPWRAYAAAQRRPLARDRQPFP